MKRLLLAASSLAMVAVAAPGASAGAAFTGLQLGVDVGHQFGHARQTRYSNIGGPLVFNQDDAEISGWVYGVHGGYNMEVSPGLIVGGELRLAYNDVRGDDQGAGGDKNGLNGKYQAALVAKVGTHLTPTSLIYANVGWSYLSASGEVLNAPTESIDANFNGLTAGAGVDFTVGQKLTMRVQYQFSDYGAKRVTYPVNLYDIETGPDTHEISLGLSYWLDMP
jgi:outer membrane immunogenic protein